MANRNPWTVSDHVNLELISPLRAGCRHECDRNSRTYLRRLTFADIPYVLALPQRLAGHEAFNHLASLLSNPRQLASLPPFPFRTRHRPGGKLLTGPLSRKMSPANVHTTRWAHRHAGNQDGLRITPRCQRVFLGRRRKPRCSEH